MALQFVGYAVGTAINGGNVTHSLTTLTGGIDTTAREDDFVVVSHAIAATTNKTMALVSSGYLGLVDLYSNDTVDANLGVFYKFMGATPDTSVEVSGLGTAGDAVASIVEVWRGVDKASPWDVTHTTTTALNNAMPNPAAITPVTPGAVILVFGAGAHILGAVNYSAYGNMTGIATTSSNTTRDITIGGAYYNWSSGSFNPTSWSLTGGSNSANSSCSVTCALRPTAPKVTLTSPADAASTSDTTPELQFVGVDGEAESLRYQVQISLAPTFLTEVIDGYAESNYVTAWDQALGTTFKKFGQSFTGDGQDIKKAQFYLRNPSGATGNATVSIYAHTGTLGSSSNATGSPLATSDPLDVTTIGTSYSMVEFTFSGANQIELVAGTNYVVVAEFNNATAIELGYDNSGTHPGNNVFYTTSWNYTVGLEPPFYVLGDGGIVLSKVSGTDSGFLNLDNGGDTDPFNSGDDMSFTVQAGDALPDGTYYWRVRAIDPSGANRYGQWSATRSFEVSTSSGPDPLDAVKGTFVMTGVAAGLIRALKLTATTASYVMTGISAGLSKTRTMAASVASFGLTGQNVSFSRTYRINATTATYALTLRNAGINYNKRLTASTATFAMTGNNTNLARSRLLAASPSSYVLTGIDVGFRRNLVLQAQASSYVLTGISTPIGKQFTLTAETQTFKMTGYAVEFPEDNELVAQTGVFAVTGNDAALNRGYVMEAHTASYVMTGNAAVTAYNRVLAAQTGAYALTLTSATFTRALSLVASQRSFVMTGISAPVVKTFAVQAQAGAFILSGIDTSISKVFVMAAETATFTFTANGAAFIRHLVMAATRQTYELTGIDAPLLRARIMPASSVTFALSGAATSLLYARSIIAETASFILTGNNTPLHLRMTATTASFILTGNNTNLVPSGRLEAQTAAFTMTGNSAALNRGYCLQAETGNFALTNNPAVLDKKYILVASPGAFTMTGEQIVFRKTYRINAAPALFTGLDTVAQLTVERNLVPSSVLFELLGMNVALGRGRSIYAIPASYILTMRPADFSISYPDIEDPFCPRPSVISRGNTPFSAGASPISQRSRPYSDRQPLAVRPAKDC